MTESAGIEIVRDEPLLEAKVLRLDRRIYRAGGREHAWEMVTRTTAAGIVACLPVTTAGEVVFLRQFRIPLGRPVIEIVAGIVEIGETPEEAIGRELSEEAGLVAEGFRKVADFTTSAGPTAAAPIPTPITPAKRPRRSQRSTCRSARRGPGSAPGPPRNSSIRKRSPCSATSSADASVAAPFSRGSPSGEKHARGYDGGTHRPPWGVGIGRAGVEGASDAGTRCLSSSNLCALSSLR